MWHGVHGCDNPREAGGCGHLGRRRIRGPAGIGLVLVPRISPWAAAAVSPAGAHADQVEMQAGLS